MSSDVVFEGIVEQISPPVSGRDVFQISLQTISVHNIYLSQNTQNNCKELIYSREC